MSAEVLNQPPEPLFDPSNPGASMDQINRLVLPIHGRILSGQSFGDMPSKISGHGYEFEGVREYVPGDDARHVDWPTTVRQSPHQLMVREHFEDVSPAEWLVTDSIQGRHRVNPGQSGFSEQELALSAATCFMMLARREGMPVGMVAANDTQIIRSKGTPKQGKKHILHLGNQLINHADGSETGIPAEERPALATLLKKTGELASRNLVVVVSDFRDVFDPAEEENGWLNPMREIRHNNNDIIAVELTNPWDSKVPENVDRLRIDGKTIWIGGKDRPQIVANYEYKMAQQQKNIDNGLKAAKATHIKLSTDNPRWFTSLREQLLRAKKHKH